VFVYVSLPDPLIHQLQRVQNAAARLVLGLRLSDHITPALYKLHWLPVRYRIEFKICLMMHSVVVRRCPVYMTEIVQPLDNMGRRQDLRSSGCGLFYVPRTKTKLGEQAFSVSGPRMWNKLPADIRILTDTKTFKRTLKTHLFNTAFSNLRV